MKKICWFKHKLTTYKFNSLFWVSVLRTLFHCFSCLKTFCNFPLEKSKGEKNSKFDKGLSKLCSLKVKGMICRSWPHVNPACDFDFKLFLHFYFVFTLQINFVKLKIMHLELFKLLRMDK
jgi:hypothetical protein